MEIVKAGEVGPLRPESNDGVLVKPVGGCSVLTFCDRASGEFFISSEVINGAAATDVQHVVRSCADQCRPFGFTMFLPLLYQMTFSARLMSGS